MALGQANRGSSLRFVYTSPGPRQVHLKGLLNWGQWKQDSWIGLATSELNGHTFFSKWKALIPLGNWRQCLVWQVKQSLMGSVEVSEGSRHRVCRRLCSGTGRTLEPDDLALNPLSPPSYMATADTTGTHPRSPLLPCTPKPQVVKRC